MSDFFLTPWTVSHQAPLSVGFSRQEYWSGWPFPSPEDHPDPGIELASPPLAGGFFTIKPIEKLHYSLSQDTEYNSLDCTVGPCSSILCTIVCICSYDFVLKVLLSWKECPLKWWPSFKGQLNATCSRKTFYITAMNAGSANQDERSVGAGVQPPNPAPSFKTCAPCTGPLVCLWFASNSFV